MRFMQMESTTFLVREKGPDPKAFRIQATCLVCRGYIREQIERVFLPFCPATEKHNRAIGVFRHADIRSRDEGPWLDTGCHGVATAALAVPHDDDITPAIPGERQNPVTTALSRLPFRKHQCENTPLTGTL